MDRADSSWIDAASLGSPPTSYPPRSVRSSRTANDIAANEQDHALATDSTLRLRLSLLITALLALLTISSGIYVVRRACDNTHAEVRSTLNLTTHFIDTELDALHERWSRYGYATPMFRLRELAGVRHLNVKFYDYRYRVLDGNENGGGRTPKAPRWFALLVRMTSTPIRPEIRIVSFHNEPIGRIVIAPDPTYEMDEIWATSDALLELLLLFFLSVNGLVWWAVSRAIRPIEHILEALSEIRQGNLAARLPDFGSPEMSRISTGFNHMAENLERSIAENQRLTRRLLQMQEQERQSLARELHDEIGQCVSAIHADAVAIRNRGGETVRESAEAIVIVAGQIKEMVRTMLQQLRPPDLDAFGLNAALRALIAAFCQRNPEVECTLHANTGLARLDSEFGIAMYRVIQECLTNVAVHASAHRVSVKVAQITKAAARGAAMDGAVPCMGALRVTVVDDGVGFFVSSGHRGLGLTGIRERVKVLGGTCEIDSTPGRGTRVFVEVPIQLARGAAK